MRSQVVDRLKLLYSNARELNKVIDEHLPGHPPFVSQSLDIAGKTLYLYYRNIIQCIRSLFCDLKFTGDLIFAPECHFTNEQRTSRVYSDMHTGDWWWAAQVCPSICVSSPILTHSRHAWKPIIEG